jgi:hypothetical protein
MKMKKSWKSMLSIVGLLLVMMTAVSVSAEDPIVRENQAPDDLGTSDIINNTEDVPMLIATGDQIVEENDTNQLPDYQNYTGDMLISPNPKANSEAASSTDLPIIGIIGAVVIIALGLIVLLVRRK